MPFQTVYKDDHKLVLRFTAGVNGRVKILFVIQGLIAAGGALLFAVLPFWDDAGILLFLFSMGFAVVLAIAAYRYFKRLTEQEELVLDKDTLTLTSLQLAGKKSRTFDTAKITALRIAGQQQYTDHPLKGESFDYFGFQTNDRQIQALAEPGNICFTYEGQTIQFAKDLPSWDAEEVIDQVISIVPGLNVAPRETDAAQQGS